MSLPVIAIPEDTIKLWSLPQPVKIRPYLVGEEKLLLLAQESAAAGLKKATEPTDKKLTEEEKSALLADAKKMGEEEVKKAVKQIITRCTFAGVNAETLPSFDIEWLFLQLRSRSVSNIIESNFRCQNPVLKKSPSVLEKFGVMDGEPEMEPCGAPVKVIIDINDIKMTVPEGHSNKVWLNADLGVTMKYPTADVPSTADVTDLLLTHLANVFTKDGEVTEISEQTEADVKAWIDTLSLSHVEKIQEFFQTMPRLTHTFTFKCEKCGYTEEVTLQGLMDFFD